MSIALEYEFLPFVVKPGRYAGGEPGQITKDPSNRLSYLHIYPDKYELGQSYPGLQMLYHIVNQDDRFVCERAFALDKDAEALLREKGIPLFSLESRRPAREFAAIGFTLVDETIYTNLLNMLNLAGIPLRSAERTNGDPIIMAGGPAAYNPEPMAPFVDLFFVGDAEEGILELLGALQEKRDLPREERLLYVARTVKSVYVPAFYDAEHRPTKEGIPDCIEARIIRDLKPEFYPSQPMVPLVETAHSHLPIEIMRGCPQGCRFCMAGAIYRPVRVRPQNDILRQIDAQLTSTGYEEVSLMSLSTTDYPEIENLATAVAKKLESSRVSINLPSLRPGSVSPRLFDAVKKVRKSGLTIAPEAGTERLRLFIRKDFPDAAIYDTVRIAFAKGWNTIKLYFMIGLPSETDDDLRGIANICRTVSHMGHEFGGRKTINVTLSAFVPKAHTPFQWDEIVGVEEIDRRIALIRRSTRANDVHFKINNPSLNILQGIIGRGGRELAPVIERAYQLGCRFDGWTEEFRLDLWKQAMAECGVDMQAAMNAFSFSRPLPWAHVRKGGSTEHLMAERQRTSITLKDFTPHELEPEQTEALAPAGEFGRGKKKVASKVLSAPTKNHLRIRWSKTARYRFMSHLDNIRFLERIIRRSNLPVAFSQGFNPSMKLSFGPPLPLGFSSEAEFVDIILEVNFVPPMLDSLIRQLPEGIAITDARVVFGRQTSLSAALNRVEYVVSDRYWQDHALLDLQLARILEAPHVMITRVSKQHEIQTDLRSAIYGLSHEDGQIRMRLGIGDGGYTRPTELLPILAEGLTIAPVALPVHRRLVWREEANGTVIDPMDI